ncbi:hypothetical protein [Endozoicomonas sp. ONNA2]|uniref:hypothetical protein n=1 Tax=Endozoicomonas sp. ONNA2 TaxID=2828741 RepID=UPI002148E128|nr:hypothetical protein [Endozoicomonas sp. ONNA2]
MLAIAHPLELKNNECEKSLTMDLTGKKSNDNPVKTKKNKSREQPIRHRAASPINRPEPKNPENLRLLMKPLPGQTNAFHRMQPLKEDGIIIESPEFKQPPGKIKKLALAIKIFSKSFETIYKVNNPETDRSSLVETIRGRVFTVTSILLKALNAVQTSAITSGLFIGAFALFASQPGAVFFLVVAGLIIAAHALLFYAMGYVFADCATHCITAAVSASVDTRQKLAEITASTSPEERFLTKYQRMEESLFALRTKLYAVKLADINDNIKYYEKKGMTEELRLQHEQRTRIESAKIEAGIPYKAKWYESMEHYFLRKGYGYRIGHLEDAIHKTEDWLNRAAKQKERLSNEPLELQEVNSENPAHWVRV